MGVAALAGDGSPVLAAIVGTILDTILLPTSLIYTHFKEAEKYKNSSCLKPVLISQKSYKILSHKKSQQKNYWLFYILNNNRSW